MLQRIGEARVAIRSRKSEAALGNSHASNVVFVTMITFRQGNLLEADVDAVVNTVNTVGVIGKGIALMLRGRYTEFFKKYAAACKAREVQVGRMLTTATHELSGPQWVIHFPTKKHWRQPSRIEWIEQGLADLVRVIRDKGIRSIALPPLGCGNRGTGMAVGA